MILGDIAGLEISRSVITHLRYLFARLNVLKYRHDITVLRIDHLLHNPACQVCPTEAAHVNRLADVFATKIIERNHLVHQCHPGSVHCQSFPASNSEKQFEGLDQFFLPLVLDSKPQFDALHQFWRQRVMDGKPHHEVFIVSDGDRQTDVQNGAFEKTLQYMDYTKCQTFPYIRVMH